MCIERPARSPRYQNFDNLTGWILIEIRGRGGEAKGRYIVTGLDGFMSKKFPHDFNPISHSSIYLKGLSSVK
jgi:hypothetical protein